MGELVEGGKKIEQYRSEVAQVNFNIKGQLTVVEEHFKHEMDRKLKQLFDRAKGRLLSILSR